MMSSLSNRRKTQGYTLIELLVVVIIIGILAAIAIINLLGLLRQNEIKEALTQLEGAVKEAQRQAMRQGKRCTVEFDTTTNQITGNPSNCLLSSRQLSDQITMSTNLPTSPPRIIFSYKGNTTNSGTIVLSSSQATDEKRCFVISNGLGIMRTGIYTRDLSQPIDGYNYCKTM